MRIDDPALEYKARRILQAYQNAKAPEEKEGSETPSPGTVAIDVTGSDSSQADKDKGSPGLEDTGRKDIDVVSNAALACFLGNVTEEACAAHLSALGLDGFSTSLEAGLVGRHRYLALRECANYLGCDVEALLATPRECLARILKACGQATWKLMGRESHLGREDPTNSVPTAHRTLTFENTDAGIRRITIDERRRGAADPHRSMNCKLSMWAPPGYAFSEFSLEVGDPGDEAGRQFAAFYAPANRSDRDAPHPGLATSAHAKAVPSQTSTSGQKKKKEKGGGNAEREKARPIHVNEFLVRRSFGSHRTNGHSQQPIRATVSILPRSGGSPRPVEFDAFWCPKCGTYFMDERTYLRLRRSGYICCKVIEEKVLHTKRAGTGLYDGLASESIVHAYGYNVNQQKNLTRAERQMILSFVIENRLQTTQEVARLLEWLIAQRESMPNMASAIKRWREDLGFVRHYHPPVRKARVDSIYAKV